LAEYKGPLAQPIIAAAGSDISFWFDEASRSGKVVFKQTEDMEDMEDMEAG
jgi:hypothetical protein